MVNSHNPEVRKHRNYAGVVVWLEPAGSSTVPQPTSKAAVMLQKGKQFVPHILAIPVGGSVLFPNVDPIFHNAFSNFAGQPFDTGLYPPGATEKIRFSRAGIVHVFCNIHSTMSAVIVVLKTPYFTVTGPDGRFDISAPPGDYELHVWHERATQQTLRSLVRKVDVSSADADGGTEPKIAISESGFIEVPHKNKYGLDYPPEPSAGAYPGGPK